LHFHATYILQSLRLINYVISYLIRLIRYVASQLISYLSGYSVIYSISQLDISKLINF
jgi:hypothetical protein